MSHQNMKGNSGPVAFVLFLLLAVVAIVIGVTVMTNQAPAIATATSTASGSALSNAGITGNTTAGLVYGFYNVIWALGGLGIAALVFLLGKSKGYF